MIRPPNSSLLSPLERYGLDLLLDLSRLLPVTPESQEDVVRLEVAERGPVSPSLRDCVAHRWYVEKSDGIVTVPRSSLDLAARIAGWVDEQRSTLQDRYGRVPASENPLASAQLEREAVISRAAGNLRDAAVASAGRRPVRLLAPWPAGCRWAATLTHDLDLVELWPLAVMVRAGELAGKGKPAMALAVLRRLIGALGQNPVRSGVRSVLDTEGDQAACSTWFVICERPTLRSIRAADVTYRPWSAATRQILDDLTTRGAEIGLHGSFATSAGTGVFERQRRCLARLVEADPAGVRQHFLKLRPGVTHRLMTTAGFSYDSSCGFSDRNGFRVGVADILPVWDDERAALAGIEQAPFCWMDRALSKYRGVEDPEAWVDDGVALAAECRAVGGLWVGVWHPNMHPQLGFAGATNAFGRLMTTLTAEHPFFGSLATMVRWRVARRAVRAAGITAGGQVSAVTPRTPGHQLSLEDPDGKPLEPVLVSR